MCSSPPQLRDLTYAGIDEKRHEILLEILSRCNARLFKHSERLLNELKNARCRPIDQYVTPVYSSDMENLEASQDIERYGTRCRENHHFYMQLSKDRLNQLRNLSSELRCPSGRPKIRQMILLVNTAYDVRRSSSFRQFLKLNLPKPNRPEATFYILDSIAQRLGKISRFYRAAMTIAAVGNKLMKNNTKIRIQGVHAKKVQIPELSSRTATQLRLRARGHQFNSFSEAQLQSMINRWPKYRLHSEIQLIVFYEENPDLKLCNNYIGCDKLSCYLCHGFITQHGQFEVNGCHSSLYSLWTVPDIVSFQNSQRASHFQHALKELCGDLERKMTALRDSRTQRQKFATNNESFANISRLSLALTVSTVERLRPEQSAHEIIPSHGEILKKSLSTLQHDLTQFSELSLIDDTGRIHEENDVLTANSEPSLTAQSSTVATNAMVSRRIERPQSRPPEMDACTETENHRSFPMGSAPILANSVSKCPSEYGRVSQNGKPRLKEPSQSRPRRHRHRKRHQKHHHRSRVGKEMSSPRSSKHKPIELLPRTGVRHHRIRRTHQSHRKRRKPQKSPSFQNRPRHKHQPRTAQTKRSKSRIFRGLWDIYSLLACGCLRK